MERRRTADSPTRSRATHTSDYHSSYVENSRATLLADVPKVPEVELESLLSAVLPDVSTDGTIERVCNELKKEYIIDDRWSFLRKDPARSDLHEIKTFAFIGKIFDCILLNAKISKPLVKCTIAGSATPLSQRSNTSRPDAYVHLAVQTFPVTSGDSWADIVMPMEFKKSAKEGSSNDDFSKAMWSMHHTMRNDPRRRFVFGLTVENTSTRFWFNDRCGIVSSTSFDLNQEWRHFVRIVLGVAAATLDQLGYDPDVKLHLAHSTSPQYDITVHSSVKSKSVYRTTGLLSEIGAESLIGRGTRIWKAQKLDSESKPSNELYALKDVWVHDDGPLEHEVITEIKGLHPEYSRYFLTVLDAGFALHSPQDFSQPDHTRDVIRRGKNFVLTGNVIRPAEMGKGSFKGGSNSASMSEASKRSHESPRSVHHTPTAPHLGHWDYRHVNRFPRRHYRIVFKEIGIPIHRLRSYQDVINAVDGGSKGLHAIHMAKYVHRDVSSGNILLVPDDVGDGKHGVIIDLEYIKRISNQSDPHGVKTGTYEFMAIEVARSRYYHLPRVKLVLNKPIMPDAATPPFRQNQLHDLESVWWILAWTTLRLVASNQNPTMIDLKNYDNVFRNHDARLAFWERQFQDFTEHLSSPVIRFAMQYWCQQLQSAYLQSYSAEQFFDVGGDCLEAVREAQVQALGLISDATKDYSSGLKFLPEYTPVLSAEAAQPDVAPRATEFKSIEQPFEAKKRRVD